MDERGDLVAEFAGLLHERAAGLAVGADDEDVQGGLRARVAERLDAWS